MPTRNINLTDHFDRFVSEQIENGRYKNASEVMRAGLRLLEKQEQRDEQKREILRKLAAEAFAELDQGGGVTLNGDQELSDFIASAGRRAGSIAQKRIAKRTGTSTANRSGKQAVNRDGT